MNVAQDAKREKNTRTKRGEVKYYNMKEMSDNGVNDRAAAARNGASDADADVADAAAAAAMTTLNNKSSPSLIKELFLPSIGLNPVNIPALNQILVDLYHMLLDSDNSESIIFKSLIDKCF